MHSVYCLIVSFMCGLSVAVTQKTSAYDIVEQYIPNAELVGSGEFSYLFWKVYDIFLFAPDGKWQENRAFAIKIQYFRSLDGDAIAERSIAEIKNQGFQDAEKLSQWLSFMRDIFPDVKNGSELTGIYLPGIHTIFFQGEKKLGEIVDPDFANYFFNIWLGENTSEPDLRRQLLRLP